MTCVITEISYDVKSCVTFHWVVTNKQVFLYRV